MHINANIKKARELRKLSQAEVAKLLDEKRSTYAEWENETIPRADIFFKISAALDVNPEDLIAEDWNPDEKPSKAPKERHNNDGVGKISLETIADDLQNVLRQQVYTRAEIRAFGEYQVMKDSLGDKERREAIMEQINKLVSVNLGLGPQMDSNAVAGK